MPDWQTLHDEYIAGGISQRKLAAKYGIDYGRIRDKSIRDGWVKDRERAMRKAQAKVEQKIATTAADNATIAARIKAKLLRKLEKELDSLPDSIGTETRQSMIERDKGKTKEATKVFKLRDLTAAYKDLTDDMQTAAGIDVEDLSPLVELLR